MSNLAYDYQTYEQYEAQRRPASQQIRRVPKTRANEQSAVKPFNIILLVVVLLCIIGTFIFSRIQLTEISEQITVQSKILNEQKSENTRLNMELGNKLSLHKVEEYAIDKLGFVKVNASQIEYIKISDSNKIQVKNNNSSNVFVSISNWFDSFLEYLS
jgi:cell division protein FtsL